MLSRVPAAVNTVETVPTLSTEVHVQEVQVRYLPGDLAAVAPDLVSS